MKIKEKIEYHFFQFLLDILNTDIKNVEDSILVSKLFGYSKHIGHFADRYKMISPDRYAQIMTGLASDEDIMSEQRLGLLKIQKRLQDIFEGIMAPSAGPLIKMNGHQELSIDDTGSFIFQFVPTRFKGEELDWNEEKKILDIIFMDLVRELDLLPERFHKCPRCDNYFYQNTEKEKKYCSIKCSNAERQAKYIKTKPKKAKKKKAAKK
jgi:hypothetical protein